MGAEGRPVFLLSADPGGGVSKRDVGVANLQFNLVHEPSVLIS
jgi:hypothetical protein